MQRRNCCGSESVALPCSDASHTSSAAQYIAFDRCEKPVRYDDDTISLQPLINWRTSTSMYRDLELYRFYASTSINMIPAGHRYGTIFRAATGKRVCVVQPMPLLPARGCTHLFAGTSHRLLGAMDAIPRSKEESGPKST